MSKVEGYIIEWLMESDKILFLIVFKFGLDVVGFKVLREKFLDILEEDMV